MWEQGRYRDGYSQHRLMTYKWQCDHCGHISTYDHVPREPKCKDLDCTSNRHMDDNGNRNYGEARVVDKRRYLLIG